MEEDTLTWVRYDDNVRNHPKVESLDDATYRLWREAIEWCAQNLTDGVILTRQLGLTSIRASTARARRLVERGLWHLASEGDVCDSKHCPPSGADGWVIHDYLDYQPTAEAARHEQAKARERKRRWLEARKNGVPDGVKNPKPDAVPDAGKNGNPAPPRPAPKGRGGPAAHQRSPAADGGGGAAGGKVEDQSVSPSEVEPSSPRCRTCGNTMSSAYHRRSCLRTHAIGAS